MNPTTIEQLMQEIDRLLVDLYKIRYPDQPRRASREDDVRLGFNPRSSSNDGPHDPWRANVSSFHGTGQTAEMALLDLKNRAEKSLEQAIESERRNLDNQIARLQAQRDALPQKP